MFAHGWFRSPFIFVERNNFEEIQQIVYHYIGNLQNKRWQTRTHILSTKEHANNDNGNYTDNTRTAMKVDVSNLEWSKKKMMKKKLDTNERR